MDKQRGSIPLIGLVAILGLIIFVFISSTASFKDKLFSSIYPKNQSLAVSSASFSLLPVSVSASEGNEVPIQLMVNTSGASANLFSAKINFDQTKLQVVRIDKTNSFITQWVETIYDNNLGKISIVGGVPKPGFTSTMDTLMATVVFQTVASGNAPVTFDAKSAIYKNAGNANFLGSVNNSTVTVIAPSPSPSPSASVTPTPSPSPSPSPSETPAPSPSPSPTPIVCTFTTALWSSSTNPITEGVLAALEVNGVGPCSGQEVAFEVREDDGLFGFDPVNINPVNATFDASNKAITSWVSEYQPDGFNGVNDPPEYYFVASLVGDTVTITSQMPLLAVNKAASTTFRQGDANRNGEVDLQDLSIMLSYWFDTTNFPDEVDINDDGIINTFDFSSMLVILTNEGALGSL